MLLVSAFTNSPGRVKTWCLCTEPQKTETPHHERHTPTQSCLYTTAQANDGSELELEYGELFSNSSKLLKEI